MNLKHYTLIGTLSAFAAAGALLVPPEALAAEQGVEELTRGPVHEAFAATVSYDPEPGIFVKTGPPSLIDEVPPDERPEGDNVNWIPGYWGWDEDQNDFLWISGIWRSLPPGREWIPGYWAEEGSQWQWTSGYWQDEEQEEVTYLPEPPKSIEAGPNIEAPSKSHIWISGSWVNREERYAWRPGYWEQGQEDWTWVPAHYQWTRRGYVFVDGYWDYDVPRRGVVFAPVHFGHDYYDRPNYSYTPLTVISLNVFSSHLFVRPRYGHYYFGDYYEPRYREEGFFASYSYRSGRGGYDPLYAHERWQHRDDRDWERHRREDFDYYRDNRDARPPRTWAAMLSRPEERRRGQRDNFQFAQPLNQYVNRSGNSRRFQKVSIENRNQIVVQNKQVRKISRDRQQIEGRSNDRATLGDDKRIVAKREKREKSPLVGKRPEQLTGKDAPPKRRAKDVEREGKQNGDRENKADDKRDKLAPGEKSGETNRPGNDANGKKGKGTPDSPRDKSEANDGKGKDRAQEKGQRPNGQDDSKDRTSPRGDSEKGNKQDQPKKYADRPNNNGEPRGKKSGNDATPNKQSQERATGESTKSKPEPRKAEARKQDAPKKRQQAPEQKQRQPEAQQKRQADPKPKRQPEPQSQRQAEPKKQRTAEPQQREAQAQRQPKQEENSGKKKNDKKDDAESDKKR